MAGGRPTSYTPELAKKATKYLKDYDTPIPSIAGLALYLKVNRGTVHRWGNEEDKPEFNDILGDILATQEQKLLCAGLTGDFNATIAKLVLGKHGYHDKADTTLSAPDGGPVGVAAFEFNPVDNTD